MVPVELYAFTLLTGITVCGLSGSILEMVVARPLSFSRFFASPGLLAWSIVATLTAGPMMLANDALRAWREGDISTPALGSCACTALVWAMAIGIVALHLAGRLSSLLS